MPRVRDGASQQHLTDNVWKPLFGVLSVLDFILETKLESLNLLRMMMIVNRDWLSRSCIVSNQAKIRTAIVATECEWETKPGTKAFKWYHFQ